MVADEIAVLHHAGAVRRAQQGAHLDGVRLVPHVQQDHVEVEGGVGGNEPRCGAEQKIALRQPQGGGRPESLAGPPPPQIPSFLAKLRSHPGPWFPSPVIVGVLMDSLVTV